MTDSLTRRSLLRLSGAALVSASSSGRAWAAAAPQHSSGLIHLNLNENAYGPSSRVAAAVVRDLPNLHRYADAAAAQAFIEQVAYYERISPDQVIPGEILGALGLYLGSAGGPGGEFLYSTPGYLALIDAAVNVGGIGVPVPLNAHFENDLPALESGITAKTRASYLINPHNPTGTVSDNAAFQRFLRSASQHAPVIVDEAYLEYTPDFETRSAVSLVRQGANVVVFRTFDKIHGLAGLPIGYALAPARLAADLRKKGFGDAESLGRLNLAAASAALTDQAHVLNVRDIVAKERAKWITVLEELKLPYTPTMTNFIFFDAGQPQSIVKTAMLARGIDVGRTFNPYTNWVRITIGLPRENDLAQHALREALDSTEQSTSSGLGARR